MTFDELFKKATGCCPYKWQTEVATTGLDGVLPVPTGLGKTEGVVLAWAWRLVSGEDEPRHLVYCLPMRTLVRQTFDRLEKCFERLRATHCIDVDVYQLMGGAIDEEWARRPDEPWVLVGTQDQLLSRALNRGYSMSRFDWPVHFGLLNNDCRWVVDETQLMGPGIWTTAQLDWMRQKRFPSLKPCRTTWMSATIGSGFLETTDRKQDGLTNLQPRELPLHSDPNPEMALRRRAVRAVGKLSRGRAIELEVVQQHQPGTLSLVVCNTVRRARELFEALDHPEKILLTSRFRREDRAKHEQKLFDFENLRRKHAGRPVPDHPGLICVSTQVVEAGVDISAYRLWSELAPWPSVIQRLGRLNRDGRDQKARAWFWETPTDGGPRKKQERIGPYDADEIRRARRLLDALIGVAANRPFSEAMDDLASQHQAELQKALAPVAAPMPRALDVHGLFSTERDVHGGFTDVSAFVRGADPDADLTVFWRDWDAGRRGKTAPPRDDDLDGPPPQIWDEGCPIPFFELRDFLTSSKTVAWTWNDEDEQWEEVGPTELRPGMVLMLHRTAGGYDPRLGWTGDSSDVLAEVPRAGRGRALRDDERSEVGSWVELAVHLEDAKREATQLCANVNLDEPLRTAVIEAAALHDLGKCHPQWQDSIPGKPPTADGPWAKFPPVLAVDVKLADAQSVRDRVEKCISTAVPLPDQSRQLGQEERKRLRWVLAKKLKHEELEKLRALSGVRWAGHVRFQPGMRHEVASTLVMWAHYRSGRAAYPALSAYLVAAHHGKARTVLRATTASGDDVFGVASTSADLDALGRQWPLDFSVAKDGGEGVWEDGAFVVTGYGWTGIVAELLGPWRPEEPCEVGAVPPHEPRCLGPFALAYLEALLRVADWRASENPSSSLAPGEVVGG